MSQRMDPPKAGFSSPSTSSQADAGINHFTFKHSKAGAVQWQVEAERARLVESEHRADLEQVRVTLFGERGWELRAAGDEGAINTATKDFVLLNRNGPIEIELQGGYRVYTNHLAWTDQSHQVTTQDQLRMTGEGIEVTGRGLLARLDDQEFRILDDVRLVLAH
jgi:lipopolysaccharide export system protein LptC